jgi:hypothetical protein
MQRSYLGLIGLLTTLSMAACGGEGRLDPPSEESNSSASASNQEALNAPPATATTNPGRAPRTEPSPRSEVDVVWRDADLSRSSRDSSAVIYARVTNNTGVEQAGNMYLVSAGLDGRTAKRVLGTFRVASRGSTDVAVPVRRLPIQSHGSMSMVVAQAEIDRGGGDTVYTPTPPLHYTFDEGYDSATFYYENDALLMAANPSLMAEEPKPLRGRIEQENGTMLNVDESTQASRRSFHQGTTSVVLATREQREAARAAAKASTGSVDATLLPARQSVKLCSRWYVFFKDSGRGEDFMATKDWHHEPARFANVQVTNSSNQVVFEGNLGSDGCATVPITLSGSYKLLQYTDGISSNGRTFHAFWATGDYIYYVPTLIMNFTVSSSTTSVTLSPTTGNPATNAAAVMGQVLLAQNTGGGLGIVARDYNVVTNYGCPEIPPYTDACYHDSTDELRTGTTLIGGTGGLTGAYWKFVMAHEVGHFVQHVAMGFPDRDLQSDVPTEQQCTCNHYDENVWSNRAHCMQSREVQGGAAFEGFAHAFAVRVFNRTTDFNGNMVYYKPFKWTATSTPLIPPLALDAWGATPGPWMKNNCVEAGKGVELDWMVFFYRISTEAQANFTRFDELFSIYQRACGKAANPQTGPKICNWDPVMWEHLLVEAQSFFGGSATNPKFVRFKNLGGTTGVNY